MKLRELLPWKSLLVFGLLLGLTGCDEGPIPTGKSPGRASLSPQPILAQIGDGYPLQPEQQEAPLPVAPGTTDLEESKVELSSEPMLLPPKVSPGVDEVVQLAKAQLGDEVLLAYIENSPARFNLGADHILYLHDLGFSAQVIAAMIRHDQNLPVPAWDTKAETELETAVTETASEFAESAEAAPPTAVSVSTAPAPENGTTVTHNYFYNTLAPYGTWMELPDYGWCWRPTVAVVDTSWRPYAHGGRWIYTDYGWYWHSYYTWGWAPFHYGRWHLSGRHGWVWMPDRHWGPAWVTWRHHAGYYGWAPLPPGALYTSGIGMTYYGSRVSVSFGFGFSSHHYAFVPVGHFYSHRPWNHCVSRGHVGPIYNNSTVINNYVRGDGNNTVINVGPGTATLTAATRTEIQKVRIREVASGDSQVVRAESLSRDGTTLNVYRPRLPEQSATPPPEITRRQQEVQNRSRQVASSDAAQAAVVKARSSDRVLGSALATTPRTTTGPSAAPRVAGGATGTRGGSEARREPVAGPSSGVNAPAASPGSRVSPGTRAEPQRAPSVSEPKSRETVSPQRSVNRTVAPQQPATQPATPRPGWSSPTPRTEPIRPSQVSPAPVRPSSRMEPARTVNPAYSVTPRPSTQPTPRAYPGVPSPSVTAPRFSPAPQQATPRSEPRSSRQSVSPSPAQTAPSRSVSPPAPSVVQPRSSGSIAPRPAPSPARPQSAPTPAPRSSGGTRNR